MKLGIEGIFKITFRVVILLILNDSLRGSLDDLLVVLAYWEFV